MSDSKSASQSLTDSPLGQNRVQWTLLTIASVAMAAMFVTSDFRPVPEPPGPDRARSGDQAAPRLRIDLNSAPSRELSLLPGVGPVLADRIVRDRRLRGRFDSVADLARVHGIGPKTIQRLGVGCDVSVDGPDSGATDVDSVSRTPGGVPPLSPLPVR